MNPWNTLVLDPMVNVLVGLSWVLFSNFGLAILVFTLLVRLVLLPLTLRQLKASKVMSVISPQMKALQQRFGKDRAKLQQETMALYKEHGVSPVGCVMPMLLQMPVLFGLYQAINLALAAVPEGLMNLSQHLYWWLPQQLLQAIPPQSRFFWLDLGKPDPFFILPVMVGVSTWVQSKMSTFSTADPQQESMNRMTTSMMPLMLGYTTVLFPSGLALYWVISNVIGVAVQYFVTGWGGLAPPLQLLHWVAKSSATGAIDAQPQPGSNGQDGRRGRRTSAPPARRPTVRSRNRRS